MVKRRIIRTLLFVFQPLSRSPEVGDWWELGKSALAVLGLGVVLGVLDWLTNLFPGWTAPLVGALLVVSILSLWAVYRLHVERRIPDNLADLIGAIYELRNVSDDLIGSLMMIAYIKQIREESGKSSDDLFVGSERIQQLLDARRNLELQELIAGPDFKRILELYRWQIELETDMCRDLAEPLTEEQYQKARTKVRDLADNAIQLLHEGRVYMPKLSTPRKAKSSRQSTS